MSRASSLALVLGLLCLPACLRDFVEQESLRAREAGRLPEDRGGVGAWCVDRVLDLTDIIDVNVGYGLGLGVRAEVSQYVQVPFGIAGQAGRVVSYGRRWRRGTHVWLSLIPSLAFVVEENESDDWTDSHMGFVLFGLHWTSLMGETFTGSMVDSLPLAIDRYRIGADVHALFGCLGLFVNTGEVVDLLGGVFGWDPALDDGLPLLDFGEPVEPYRGGEVGSPAQERTPEP